MQLPFKTEELNAAWIEWIEDRKERKIKPYTTRGLKAQTTHLLEIAEHNEQIAVQIINQSITQGWQGLFPLKNVPRETNRPNFKQPDNRQGTSVARIEALRNW